MASSQRHFPDHQRSNSHEEELCSEYDNELCGGEYGFSYDTMKGKIIDTIASAQKMIEEPEFINLVQKDCKVFRSIDKDLSIRHEDMKRDCAIIFAGETSSGKSTIINRIVGENIIPVKIHASTRKVCRIKYSEKLQVSTFNTEGTIINDMFFENAQEMKTSLLTTVESTDKSVQIVDIWYPVRILKTNRTCTIVDTPGIGDKEQDDVAEIMKQYLPNALAFVFVVNVDVAGGLQTDRIQVIFEKVKGKMEEMVSFDPSDVVFLLNKWDSLIFEEESEELFYKTMKDNVRNLWKDARGDYILKSAGGRVKTMETYEREFKTFLMLLNDVISRKANRRVKGHVQFLKEFFGNCEVTISRKLETTKLTAEENSKRLCTSKDELEKLEVIRKEALSNIQTTVDDFLEEASNQLFQYINQESFKEAILKDINDRCRFSVGFMMDSRMKDMIGTWERENIQRIFEETVMTPISEKLTSIYQKLNAIKKDMSGIEPPFDAENKIISVLAGFIAPSGTGFLASFLLNRILLFAVPGGAIIALSVCVGTLISTVVALGLTNDFDTFCIHAFEARKNALTKKEIKAKHENIYAKKTEELITEFFDGEVKDEINDLYENVKKMKDQLQLFRDEKKNLLYLRSRIGEIKRLLRDFD